MNKKYLLSALFPFLMVNLAHANNPVNMPGFQIVPYSPPKTIPVAPVAPVAPVIPAPIVKSKITAPMVKLKPSVPTVAQIKEMKDDSIMKKSVTKKIHSDSENGSVNVVTNPIYDYHHATEMNSSTQYQSFQTWFIPMNTNLYNVLSSWSVREHFQLEYISHYTYPLYGNQVISGNFKQAVSKLINAVHGQPLPFVKFNEKNKTIRVFNRAGE